MDIDRYERYWILISAVVLAALFGILLYGAYGLDIHVETNIGQIDVAEVETTPPFDNLGLHQVGEREYQAVLLARAWTFVPAEITVPVGSTVTFVMTSLDVIHGFKIPQTTVNRMVIPGQVTEVTHTFNEPGRFSFFCHEYCGVGHHVMNGAIVVEP